MMFDSFKEVCFFGATSGPVPSFFVYAFPVFLGACVCLPKIMGKFFIYCLSYDKSNPYFLEYFN